MSRHPDREGWFRGSNVVCEPALFPRKRTYRLALLGPPGVGKGAQAKLLCDRLGTCHLAMATCFGQVHVPLSPALPWPPH